MVGFIYIYIYTVVQTVPTSASRDKCPLTEHAGADKVSEHNATFDQKFSLRESLEKVDGSILSNAVC